MIFGRARLRSRGQAHGTETPGHPFWAVDSARLAAAKKLKRAPVEVTLIDKRNFHLFQRSCIQVATGSLSPGEIAAPLRGV